MRLPITVLTLAFGAMLSTSAAHSGEAPNAHNALAVLNNYYAHCSAPYDISIRANERQIGTRTYRLSIENGNLVIVGTAHSRLWSEGSGNKTPIVDTVTSVSSYANMKDLKLHSSATSEKITINCASGKYCWHATTAMRSESGPLSSLRITPDVTQDASYYLPEASNKNYQFNTTLLCSSADGSSVSQAVDQVLELGGAAKPRS